MAHPFSRALALAVGRKRHAAALYSAHIALSDVSSGRGAWQRWQQQTLQRHAWRLRADASAPLAV